MASSKDVVAGGASVRIGADDAPFKAGLLKAEQRLRAFGASAAAIGAKMAGLGIGIGVGIVAAAKSFADAGSSLDDMAQRTGDSAQNLSELAYAAQMSGTDIATLEGAFGKMSSTIAGASAGEKASVSMLKKLGLTAADLAGKLPSEQLAIFADKLAAITDQDQRADMVKAIFGKSGGQLLPLLNGGATGIAELRAEAERLGLTMSDADAQGAAKLGDSLDQLTGTIGGVVNKIGGAFAPAISGVVDYLAGATASAGKFISENKGLVLSVGLAAGGIVGVGIALIATGAIASGVGSGLGALSAVISGIYSVSMGIATIATNGLTASLAILGSPLALGIGLAAALGAGVIALGGGFDNFGESMNAALSGASGLFGGLSKTATDTFGGIASAIGSGNIQGAINILWAGIKLAWQQGVEGINSLWNGVGIYLTGTMDSAVLGVTKVWAGLQTGWTIVVTSIESAFDRLSVNMVGGWTTVITGIRGGIDIFATAISNAFNEVLLKIREAKVALSVFNSAASKATAYANIEVDRKAAATKSAAEAKKRADERQKEINAAFDNDGLAQRDQARNNRVAGSGDTRRAESEFAARQAARMAELGAASKPSEETLRLQSELAALLAEQATIGEDKKKELQDQGKQGEEAAKGIAETMKSPAAQARNSSGAASSIARAVNSQSNVPQQQLDIAKKALAATLIANKELKEFNKNKITFKEVA